MHVVSSSRSIAAPAKHDDANEFEESGVFLQSDRYLVTGGDSSSGT